MKNTLLWIVFFLALHLSEGCSPQPRTTASPFRCPPCGNTCDQLSFAEAGICPHCGMTLTSPDQTSVPGQRNVAILIFDGMEILDFSGPCEVFAAAGGFHVYTVAATKSPIVSQGVVKIVPEFSIADCPKPDIIVLPGGSMTAPLDNAKVIDWIKSNEPHLEVALSVCTGAFLLEKAGLLEGKKATTFHNAIEDLRKKATKTEVLEHVRWVDNGKIVTTAGVSAGIDGSLRVVERLLGPEKALSTAYYMEYDKWIPKEGLVVREEEKEKVRN